jgi:hypothetical protein
VRTCVRCGRELLPNLPWYLRGPLSGFGPMPACKTDLAECRAGLMRRLGLDDEDDQDDERARP